jgi:hypothetical protein
MIRLNTSTIDYVNDDGPIYEILEETNRLVNAVRNGTKVSDCVSSNY